MGEAWGAWKGWKATGRVKVELPEDGSCPFLNPSTNLCLIYESRPVACRTHFCSLAGGVIPRNAMIDIIRELEDIDQRCGGDGGVRLPDIEKRLARKR